jgi:sulfate permease, SulP family
LNLGRSIRNTGYSWAKLGGDAAGGTVAALIALPYGLAMATLMGLPPVLGIFTSILTSPVTAILGRNPMLIGGTGSATVPFIAEAVKSQGIAGAAKVSIVAAVIMMAFCVLRLGRHIARVPHAVVTGFSCGIGAIMVISQLDIILGLPTSHASGTIGQLAAIIDHLESFRIAPFVIAMVVILAATACTTWVPRIPAPLVGIVLAVVVAKLLSFQVGEIGTLPSGLPPFVGFAWNPKDIYVVLPAAFGLAFVTSVNVLITSRVVEHFRGRHRRHSLSDADAELGAYGIANVCAGTFGAPLSVGIPARSLAAVRCGGTTRLSNIFHALILILMLRYAGGLISHIPLAAMAGVTAWMGFCLLDWSAWHRLTKMTHADALGFLVTAGAVVLVNAVLAVAIGCLVYWAPTAYRRLFGASEQIPNLQTP